MGPPEMERIIVGEQNSHITRDRCSAAGSLPRFSARLPFGTSPVPGVATGVLMESSVNVPPAV